MRMKNAFVTYLGNDEYLDGCLVINKNLKDVGAKFPFYVLLGNKVTEKNRNILKALNINIIELTKNFEIPKAITDINSANYSNWNYTFEKLFVFDLIEFGKIVFIDSDMLIRRNIDELFNEDSLSAVCAGNKFPGNESWKGLNSGLMVITPKAGMSSQIMESYMEQMPTIDHPIGDQDLIKNYYSNWDSQENLKLHDKYNILIGYIDFYCRNIVKFDDISIIHYVGPRKPWNMNFRQIVKRYIRFLICRNVFEFKAFSIYRRELRYARKEIKYAKN